MKKLILTLAILGFVTFGALSIQNLIASTSHVEMANFDKDPKKDDNKKAADTKEVKAEAKTEKSASDDCGTSCGDKSASTHSCCGGEKASTSETAKPDVK